MWRQIRRGILIHTANIITLQSNQHVHLLETLFENQAAADTRAS